MLTRDEIFINFINNLKLASDDFKEAEKLAINDPLTYLKSKYISKLEFQELTNRALEDLKNKRPELYFEFNLYKRKELKDKRLDFANKIIDKEPINALMYYKFHRKPEFQGLIPGLFTSLHSGGLESYGKSMETLSKEDGILFKEIMYLVEKIAKDYPWYYLGNKLADLNSEFAKYFGLINNKNKLK